MDGDELKKDLQTITQWWETLDDEQKKERSAEYGNYPPQNDESVTHRMWCKHMQPWRPGAGDRTSKLTDVERQSLIEEITEVWKSSR